MSYVWASNFSIFGGLLYVPKTGFEWNTREQDLGSIWHSGHTYLPCVLKRCAKPQRLHEGEARLPQQPEDLRLALPGRRRFVLRISVAVELGMENGKLDSEKMTCLSEILATSTWCCMAAAANPFAPRSKRWKSLSVFWLCFPWEPQAASCRTPWWILLEDESASTALAISAAVSTWAPPRPTRSNRVSNNKLFPDAMGSRLHLLTLYPFPGKTVWQMNYHTCSMAGLKYDTSLCQIARGRKPVSQTVILQQYWKWMVII